VDWDDWRKRTSGLPGVTAGLPGVALYVVFSFLFGEIAVDPLTAGSRFRICSRPNYGSKACHSSSCEGCCRLSELGGEVEDICSGGVFRILTRQRHRARSVSEGTVWYSRSQHGFKCFDLGIAKGDFPGRPPT
jgi:hypothetical protein